MFLAFHFISCGREEASRVRAEKLTRKNVGRANDMSANLLTLLPFFGQAIDHFSNVCTAVMTSTLVGGIYIYFLNKCASRMLEKF